jgi:hypothetical protein
VKPESWSLIFVFSFFGYVKRDAVDIEMPHSWFLAFGHQKRPRIAAVIVCWVPLLEMKKIQRFFSIPISCISSRIGGCRKQDVDFIGFDGCVGICFGFFASEWDRATGGDWTCGTGTSQEQNGLHPSQSRLCCFRGPFRIQYEQWVEKRIAKIGASQTDQPIIRSQLLEITLIGTPNPFPLHLQSPILLNSKP